MRKIDESNGEEDNGQNGGRDLDSNRPQSPKPGPSGGTRGSKRKNKNTTSPRKIGKTRRSYKRSPRGATASFEEDDNVVIIKTSEMENLEFPDSQGSGRNRGQQGAENNNANPDPGEGTDVEEDGELDESLSSCSSSSSDSEDEPTPAKSKKQKVVEPSTSVEDLEVELRRVNEAMEKMQRLMEHGDYGGQRSRSRRRTRSHSPRRRRSRSHRSRTRSRSGTPRRRRRSRSGPRGKGTVFSGHDLTVTSPSESTIYKQAVQPNHRTSTSSEEADQDNESQNYSDEETYPSRSLNFNTIPKNLSERSGRSGDGQEERARTRDGPSSSGAARFPSQPPRGPPQPTPEERADSMVREAEAAKVRMLEVAGKGHSNMGACAPVTQQLQGQYAHSAMVDESFLLVAAHIDNTLRERIERGEYIDFSRLIPTDQVLGENENRMQWVQENGELFLTPASNRQRVGIHSFLRWEQAFRVFSDIYTRAHPARAAELIQYNHIIGTAAATYTWENVYYYDCRFRIHMAHNPARSWAIILQQAWRMYLKDRHRIEGGGHGNNNNNKSDRRFKKDVCYRYNRGKCSYGANCKFDHRCAVCGKAGHGSHNCRRLQDKPQSFDRKPDRRDDFDRRDRQNPPSKPGASASMARTA